MEGLKNRLNEVNCEKIDILSYSYGKTEALISYAYLKFIHALPKFYSSLYHSSVYKNIDKDKRFRLYETLFLRYMRKLIAEKKPDMIVCTHALPSYMLSRLKVFGEISIPVINVYTDYFIHQFWGIQQIDYHFVPTAEAKNFLLKKGTRNDQIFMTGIPIHADISKKQLQREDNIAVSPLSILICGGNLGVGAMDKLIKKMDGNRTIQFYVLCGKNRKLYHKLHNLHARHIIPLNYIKCRKKMNELYERVDAILTKPGGVTISECLFKRKPIFIYHTLPGQEEINLHQLNKLGMVLHLKDWNKQSISLEEQLLAILQDQQRLQVFQDQLSKYHNNLTGDPAQIMAEILKGKII